MPEIVGLESALSATPLPCPYHRFAKLGPCQAVGRSRINAEFDRNRLYDSDTLSPSQHCKRNRVRALVRIELSLRGDPPTITHSPDSSWFDCSTDNHSSLLASHVSHSYLGGLSFLICYEGPGNDRHACISSPFGELRVMGWHSPFGDAGRLVRVEGTYRP